MSRYTGYNQRGFANSTVAVTRAASGSSAPVNYANTITTATALYLPFDTSVTADESPNNVTVTASGQASLDTTTKKFGAASLNLSESSGADYLTFPTMALNGDFTIEGFFRTTMVQSGSNPSTRQALFTYSIYNNSTDGFSGLLLWLSGDGTLKLYASASSNSWNVASAANFGTITVNTWHHFALTRSGTTINGYLDGSRSFSLTGTSAFHTSATTSAIGSRNTVGAYGFNGQIDDFRILDGKALYTDSSLTVPTSAVGLHHGVHARPVSLYLPFDSDVNDDSSDPFTITASGGAAISSAQAKFGGNSLGLDGTNDYLTVSSSQYSMAFAGDFTIEYWMYFTSLSGSYVGPMGCHSGSGWLFQFASGGGRFYIDGSYILNTTAATSSNQWYHVAVSRTGPSVKLFIDGVEQDSLTYSSALPTNNDLIIGASNASGQYFPGYLDDIRIIDGVGRYTKNFVPPSQAVGATLNGTNETNSTTGFTSLKLNLDSDFTDTGPSGHSMTTYGDTQISTAQKKFGVGSALFDGNGDYLSTPASSDFAIGSGDFTVSLWYYPISEGPTNGGPHYSRVFNFGNYWNNTDAVVLMDRPVGGGGKFVWQAYSISNSYHMSSTTSVSNGQWYHLQICRSGSTFYLFVNGNLEDTYTSSVAITTSENVAFHLAGAPGGSGAEWSNSYIDDVLVLKGYALNTASFTPPTSPLTTTVSETVNDLAVLYLPFDGTEETSSVAASQTSLYLPFDSDTNDDSAQSHTVTNNGVTISSAQSKFGGYSALFDGTNDYLSIPSNSSLVFGDEDFTVEFFIYTNDDTHQTPFTHRDGSPGAGDWTMPINRTAAGQIEFYNGGYSISSPVVSTTISGGFSGGWHHIAVTRSGDIHRLFFDGELKASATNSTTYSSGPTELHIGRDNYIGGRDYLDGYLDDFRVLKGTALYTESFTVPTSALGATGTTISVGGGFEDLARNNGVTKDGDVALNSSVKKFGTSSAYFDGAGDRLVVDHGGELNLSDGDFTIEGWFYFTSNATARIFHGEEGSGTFSPWLFYTTSAGAIQFYATSNYSSWDVVSAASLGTVTLNTWTHLAVTREGNSFRCFQDGVLKSTTTSSSSLYYNTDNQIAIGGRDGNNHMSGYADDLRIIKGKAIYTAAFTPPTSAHGHVSLEQSTSTSETYSDSKFLSGVWDMTDVRDKMMQSTWVSNDSRLPNGAGLQDENHRWYSGPSGTPFTITAYGAGGGDSDHYSGQSGGAGGYAQLTVNIAGPDTLYVVVGQGGNRPGPGTAPGGRAYGGGGGSRLTSGTHPHQAPGGGLSGVFMSPYSENGDSAPGMPSSDVMIVAGGGGGAGSGSGGAGGGETGQDGQSPYSPGNGGGGGQGSGGAAGTYSGSEGTTAGVFLTGGRGNLYQAGGGGGGGYYGGGGGGYGTPPANTGSGGGGSGYVGGASGFTVSNTTNTQGGGAAAENNGQVRIRNNDTEVTTIFNYTGSEQTYNVT